MVTLPEFGGGSRVLDVLLTRSDRTGETIFGSVGARPLQNGKTVRLHLGSGHRTARVSLLERGELAPGGQSLARLRCERPVFAFAGDRFILRDGAGRNTLAGGLVLDPEAECRRSFRRGVQRRFLQRQAWAENDVAAAVEAVLERDHALPRAGLLQRSAFSAAETDAAVVRLLATGSVAVAGERVANAAWWLGLQAKAAGLMDAEHREHPERFGLALARLRADLKPELKLPALFDALVAALVGTGGFVRVGASVRRAAHRPTLPAHLQAAGARLRAALAQKPFEPPSRQQLAPDGASRQALRFLFDTGEALELGEEIVLLEESFRQMRTVITRTLRSAGPATASDLRQVLGTTRRVLIPVLERLDREGVTRREGDRRSLRLPVDPGSGG